MAYDHIVMAVYEGYTAGWHGTYTDTLIAGGCSFTNYRQIDGGGLSEPCYIQFSSGSDQGLTTDNCPQSTGAENLWHEMQVAGKTLVGYFEDMPSVGYTGCATGNYVRRHNPFIQFTNISDQSINVPFNGGGNWPGWNSGLTDYSSLPLFTFLKASIIDDGHSGSMTTADAWVQSHCDNYIQWAKTHNSLFIIFADDDGSTGPVVCVIVGAGVTPGSTNNQSASHGSMANTLAGLLGVAPFPGTPAALTGWFTAPGGTAPAVVTGASSAVSATSATVSGTVNPEGAAATWQFQFGTTTGYGSVLPASPGSAGSGTSAVTETQLLTGLAAGTTYHYRLTAANATGTGTGSDASFTTTSVSVPAVVTGASSAVSATSATVSGTVNPEGQSSTWQFQYGLTTSYGLVSPAAAASAGGGTTAVTETATLTGLAASTTYHYRLIATNASGTGTGSDSTFATAAAGGTAPTVYNFTVEVTDSAGNTATRAETLVVDAVASTLAVSTASLPAATVNTAYSATLAATGGSGTGYSWSVSGLLPAGLSLNSSSGIISGTPSAAGTASFSAGVTDSAGNSATRALSISVTAAASTLTVTTASLPAATQGTAYSDTLTASGGTGAGYTWAVTSGSLPAGLSLSSGGTISGTPSTAGSSSFTTRVTDSGANTASQALSLLVNSTAVSLVITTASLPACTVGTAYSTALAATGGSGSGYAWSVSSGTLPAGLSLSAAGVITGTPTLAGSSSLTFRVTDSGANAATKALSLTVSAAVSGSTAPVGPTGTWTMVFEDTFTGTSLNTSHWTALQGASINNVSTSASAVSVSGGYLRIGFGGAVNSNPASGYPGPSSGPAVAVGNCVEASINFPGPSGTNQYNWPAWWCDAGNWPSGGEEDITEGYDSSLSALNYHSPSGANNGPHPSGNWCNSFHTYTLIRGSGSNGLKVYWDGVLMRSVTPNDSGAAQSMIINVGSGNASSSSAVVLVAYVRMWTPG